SIGVATFDGLDAEGNAYESININIFGPADTLTSQPINLSSFVPGDSLYLSFFYQAQGLSYEVLKTSDSLVLQFKNRIGAWLNVWSSPGITQQPFKQALVAVKDTMYLHGTFQFRWINYQQYLGNLKQWHVDYVYLNQGRNAQDTLIEDQAVVELPPSPFQPYTHIPWNHVQQNFGKYLRSSFVVPVSNLANSGETFSVSMRVENPGGTVGFASLSGQNLPAKGITPFTLSPNISLQTGGGDSSYVRVISRLGDILGGNDIKKNDSAVRYIELANYYAYDDGTAESGYGIRNASGSVAYGFELEKGDSLRGIWIHFTQAEQQVRNGFALNVWTKIAPENEPSSGVDELVYSKESGIPAYTDSINGFYLYLLDSAVYVSGTCYIGWTQNSSFLINVGLDRNYRHQGAAVPNPKLFYNVNGSWKRSSVPGTIMMRPVVGDMWPTPSGVPQKAEIPTTRVYPNPAHHSVTIQSEREWNAVQVIDLQGKSQMIVDHYQSELDISGLKPGMYLLRVLHANGTIASIKLSVE
ncbi:MAG: T9SS type A sorting domain-containing protein, partial [Bacteroidota bacterium]|nr:T9SS type A sorting domain-containing protein [Bacteroidota bacterium]MDX5430144.1 T9SS type A sorting domain-containing protein [Bacteroidota bacterium]MDX5468905.1 T9SS type A sorting domain-containing protein [Bacteroidota bacterium]